MRWSVRSCSDPRYTFASRNRRIRRPLVWSALLVLILLSLALPAAAQIVPDSPTLSTSDRLEDRRYVASGTRGYIVGDESGRFPAMGWHIRGEMGGIWSPPIKLLDGIWFGIDDTWIGPATEFTSGYGYVEMNLPDQGGLTVTRTDFVPDGRRAALFGLTFTGGTSPQTFTLKMDAHSELMSAYPWGWTNPSQESFNLNDTVAVEGDKLVFREQGKPPAKNALRHDWAAVVGSNLTPTGSATGTNYRGPQGNPPVICPLPDAPTPYRCDDSAFGEGKGGQLRYDVSVGAGEEKTVWFAVAGADFDGRDPANAKAAALEEYASVIGDPETPEILLQKKVSSRLAFQNKTRLTLSGDDRIEESIDWSKQNLADSVQVARDLEIRETDEGRRYPPPEGGVDRVRFLGAGFPDYQWLFGTDGEYTAFASVGVGQFKPIKDHLRALKEVSLIDNGDSGKVVHEVVTEGSIYFGSNDDPGNTDETAKFPSAVALIWRWTGDNAFRDEMYGYTKKNMHYIFRELDDDGDGWPEGLGNVERAGMGEEKLDNTVYTIRGLLDLADMARSKGDLQTARWAEERAQTMKAKFEEAWWFGQEEATQYADSIDDPADPTNDNKKIFQRHWIGVTPMEAELVRPHRDSGPVPGLATFEHGNLALDERDLDKPGELACYTDTFGMYHTGTGPTIDGVPDTEPFCDDHQSEVPAERSVFTLNTAVMAVGEGNYGRLGEDQQQHYMNGNADLQLGNDGAVLQGNPDEQPGAMPEIAPSPDYGRSINKPFTDRAMVLQAWGAYGTIWPVVHQWLGVRPDMGRRELEVVPQVPPGSPEIATEPEIAGENIRLGSGSVDVFASAEGSTYTTTVNLGVAPQEFVIGHTLPSDASISSVTLDGVPVTDYSVRVTNRGKEVLVQAPSTGEHTLIVTTAP